MRGDATVLGVPVRVSSARAVARWALVSLTLLLVAAALVGLLFAGSPARLAEGVRIAGVDVGGLAPDEARRLLERRAAEAGHIPVVFTAGEQRYPVTSGNLGLKVDWAGAVASAQREGEGFGPVRGFKRLHARFFGADVAPAVQVYTAALDYKLGQLSKEIDRPDVEASLRLKGLDVEVVQGQTGQALDRARAAEVLVRSLARLERTGPVALPVKIDPVEVTAPKLARAAAQARLAVSAPVRLTQGETAWRLPRWRVAELLSLPTSGATRLAIAGPAAEAWFAKLQDTVGTKPVDATFRVVAGAVEVVPAKDGLAVDVPATAQALLTAATSSVDRTAELAVRTAPAQRTTADAQAMGIERQLSSYTTAYAGTSDRITNLQLGVTALDGTLVGPGEEFSFNDVVGERTLERGFRTAPVIYEGEYQEDVGGGVSQVATTVFNAAWEAGLKITERNPHLFYISRYQLGRDATVNYPDLDLRFLNDTDTWILMAGGYGGGSITVSIYGGGPERRVVSEPSPLRTTTAPPVKRIDDPTLEQGTTKLDDPGTSGYATSVKRTIYAADGDVIREETWNTSYRGEYKVILVGTKPKPKAPPKPPLKPGETGRPDALQPGGAATPAPNPRP
jgi:vancomycin resistance protein YoaR